MQADLAAICHVVDQAVGFGVAEAGLRKCLEGAHLVALPVKGTRSKTASSTEAKSTEGAEDGWDAWEGEAEQPNTPSKKEVPAIGGGEELGLWEVEQRLFADNQSAREVLEELGFETLSETEARAVLGRRVELVG